MSCPYCGSSRVENGQCQGCGASISSVDSSESTPDVMDFTQSDESTDDDDRFSEPDDNPFEAQNPSETRRLHIKIALFIVGIFVAIIAVILVVVFWKKPVNITVVNHSWKREIVIENYLPRKHNERCGILSHDAYNIRKYQKKRGTSYEEWCEYMLDEWEKARSVVKTGDLNTPPSWPAVPQLRPAGGVPRPIVYDQSLFWVGRHLKPELYGQERVGPSNEYNTLHFNSDNGESLSCSLPYEKWRSTAVGSRFTAELGVITKHLDCTTLKPI